MARYLNLGNSTINMRYILKNSMPEIVGKLNIRECCSYIDAHHPSLQVIK